MKQLLFIMFIPFTIKQYMVQSRNEGGKSSRLCVELRILGITKLRFFTLNPSYIMQLRPIYHCFPVHRKVDMQSRKIKIILRLYLFL